MPDLAGVYGRALSMTVVKMLEQSEVNEDDGTLTFCQPYSDNMWGH